MNFEIQKRPRGIALIIVLLVVIALGIMAAGFSRSMQVEVQLARNDRYETELEWIGRSGVEFARYVLVQEAMLPNEPWDSLSQKWAGGPLGTNDILEDISLSDNELGSGSFSVKIVDLERKYNINQISDPNSYPFRQALQILGVDAVASSAITDSLLDWLDVDDNPHLNGTESKDYMVSPNPGFTPYLAKNGPIDEMAELLRVRGVTPELYWGSSGKPRVISFDQAGAPAESSGGLVDLFTAISSGSVNINTASAAVLQIIPGIDPDLAQAIVQERAGPDGIDGTDDDLPYRSVGDLGRIPGVPPQLIQQLAGSRSLVTRSSTFQVFIEAKIGNQKRGFVALLLRNGNNLRDIQPYYFHWN